MYKLQNISNFINIYIFLDKINSTNKTKKSDTCTGKLKPLNNIWKRSGLMVIVYIMIFMNNIKTYTP